jgi:hypothetical protein
MNILAETTQNMTDVFKHYVCIRMQFRSNVLRGTVGSIAPDKRFQEYCPAKH